MPTQRGWAEHPRQAKSGLLQGRLYGWIGINSTLRVSVAAPVPDQRTAPVPLAPSSIASSMATQLRVSSGPGSDRIRYLIPLAVLVVPVLVRVQVSNANLN